MVPPGLNYIHINLFYQLKMTLLLFSSFTLEELDFQLIIFVLGFKHFCLQFEDLILHLFPQPLSPGQGLLRQILKDVWCFWAGTCSLVWLGCHLAVWTRVRSGYWRERVSTHRKVNALAPCAKKHTYMVSEITSSHWYFSLTCYDLWYVCNCHLWPYFNTGNSFSI